ncbi:hypothetical protein KR044_009904 [Drosophila immigrans]|nr:hypothetical protein KR044_009904 [Drosophila immigrans]
MRSVIIATIAVVLVAAVGATSYQYTEPLARPGNVYLPPAVTSYRPAPRVITTVQRPVVHQPRVYSAPIVNYTPLKQVVHQPRVYSAPIVNYAPRQQVVHQQRIYSAPIVDYAPRQQVVRTQQIYNAPIVDYAPRQQVVRTHNVYSTPVVQQVVRPERVYLPPAVVQHPVVHQQRVIEAPVVDYGVVQQPRNTYLPPAADIDLRSSFADKR